MAKHSRLYNTLLLLLFLLAGGIASSCLNFELQWDWANYHYYNAWAFFYNRWMYDLMPAGINTFFNPLPDIPLYLMTKYWNNFPTLILFMQGLWSGAAAFVFCKIVFLFFDVGSWKGRLQALIALLIGVTSWAYASQIGTSTNEMPLALLVLSSWWLLLREVKSEKNLRPAVTFGVGLMLGAAAGLKYTAVIYCISTGLSLLCWYRYFGCKAICWLICGGIAGFLLTNGFWMWRLWNTFGNPVFPLFNNVFKSEYFDFRNFYDKLYYPKTILEYVFYPLYLAADKVKIDTVDVFIEYRHLLMFVIASVYAVYYVKAKCFRKKMSVFCLNYMLWTLCFVTYLVWLTLFAIQRYYIANAMLYSVIIVQAATYIYPKKSVFEILYLSLLVILFWILFSTPYYSDLSDKRSKNIVDFNGYIGLWPELKTDDKYFTDYDWKRRFVDMEDIELPQETVLKLYGMPNAGALPMFNRRSNVRGVLIETGGFDNEGEVLTRGKWLELKQNAVSNSKIPALLFPMNLKLIPFIKYYRSYAKSNHLECHRLVNNIYPWILCVPPEQVKSVFKDRYHEEK